MFFQSLTLKALADSLCLDLEKGNCSVTVESIRDASFWLRNVWVHPSFTSHIQS